MVRGSALLAAAVFAFVGCGGDEPPGSSRDAQDPVVVWAVGDAATAGEEPRPLAEYVTSSDFDRLLYLGDVYENGTRAEFRRFYEPLYGSVARKTSPIAGNHESANRRRGYIPYWRSKLGRAPQPWYSVSAGGWTLLALDTELPHDAGSEQERWLREQVREDTTCRIAFWHRPRYSAGQVHGDQPDVQPLWDALRGRAVAVLSGHDHNMQRFDPVDGIVQFVSGAGGRALYEVDDGDDRVAFSDDERFGALRLELVPGRARWQFVSAAGQVLDRGDLPCE